MSASPTPNVIVCNGTPQEMGRAQGAQLKAKIRDARQALGQLEAFRLQQPAWLPYPLYRWLAGRRASRYLSRALIGNAELWLDRLAGIAAGAGLTESAIHLFNALEPVLSSVSGCTACPSACSAVAVRGRRSANGQPMVARNFDYLPLVQPFYVIRDCRPTRGLRALEFTTAPLAGAVDGMNEAGLCITYDYAFTTDLPAVPAPPISLAISTALAQCETVAAAAELIGALPRWGGGMLMLADATGDLGSLELSSTRCQLRRPAPGEDLLYHTNAFATPTMREVQVPWDAVFTDAAPQPLRGRRLHHSSEMRDRRYAELLARQPILDLESLAAIMADHGPDGKPSELTPCVHGTYWFTTACLQFLPCERRLRFAFDTACRAQFVELQVGSTPAHF